MCGSGVDVASSLLLISAILMAVGEQPFHLSRCPNFRNRLSQPMESWTRWKSGEQQRPYARLADPSKAPSGCGSSVTSLAFLAGDSSLLAAGCPDGKIILFDFAAPK